MNEWWEGLNELQKIFYYFAFPATVVLLIQTILTVIGLGSDTDVDIDADSDMDFDSGVDAGADIEFDAETDTDTMGSSSGIRFFSIRGFIAFFCIFGWSGAAMSKSNMDTAVVIFLAVLFGFVAMLVIGAMFYAINRLQSSGNINYKNALGKTAEVYIPVPKSRSGMGKIMVTVQERLIEADAMTDSRKALPTGTIVKIVDVINPHIYIIEKE